MLGAFEALIVSLALIIVPVLLLDFIDKHNKK